MKKNRKGLWILLLISLLFLGFVLVMVITAGRWFKDDDSKLILDEKPLQQEASKEEDSYMNVEQSEASTETDNTEYIVEHMNWSKVYTFPSAEEISSYNNQATVPAPYIAGWMQIPDKVRYTEYMIDFRAEYLPAATYCCLGNWKMDYSSLLSDYVSVRTEYEGVQGYAGFQSLEDGQRVSILSFWDIFCKDSSGNETTIRAKLVYPESTDNDSFGGEGTGAHCLVPYDWQDDHWYRMHMVCTKYEDQGNTIVEQWVCDLETGEETLLCAYDTGVKDTCFIGSTAVFLENFLPSFAGEIRTMEVREAKYCVEATGEWKDIKSAYLMPNGGLPGYCGKYNFGLEGDRFWMITGGLGGDWYGNPSSSKGRTYIIND